MNSSLAATPALAGTSVTRVEHAHAPSRPAISAGVGIAVCLLLAVVQVAVAGYQLGVGNQSIQIAFLKAAANPKLFTTDVMVQQTMPLYPSYFFKALAPLVTAWGLEPTYLALQLLTGFLTLAAVYTLGRSIFRSHAAGLAGAALLVAGHHTALAGESLYYTGFTHTYFAFPIAVFALCLAYRRRMVAAFALAGILFNIHALTAAYVMLMLGAALLADLGRERPRLWLMRAAAAGGLAILLAAPTLVQMASQRQEFNSAWVNLMRVRSAEHSFPSTWWSAGNPDLPRFVLMFALFVLSFSFAPVRWKGFAVRTARVTLLMTLALLGLFALGYVFSEIIPWPTMIRLQPFRASRLLLVLMLVNIAHGAVAGIRSGWNGRAHTAVAGEVTLALSARICEVLAGVLLLLTLGVPALLPLLPWTVLIVTATALVTGRLGWGHALVAAGALTAALLAHLQIQFAIPGLGGDAFVGTDKSRWADGLAWLAMAAAVGSVVTAIFLRGRAMQWGVAGMATFAGLISMATLYQRDLAQPAFGTASAAALGNVETWAKDKTPEDAVFLTPTGMANFRIGAERAIVGDWRDGTQLYFSAKYAPQWFSRMRDLEPHLTLAPGNTRLLARDEESIAGLSDEGLLGLAKKYHAGFILLPHQEGPPRALEVAYENPAYTVYLPQVPKAADAPPPPEGVINPVEWAAMENFMHTTVAQNIEKYRKADLTLQLVDPQGRPLQNCPVVLEQTSHTFGFGVSLGFFQPNNVNPVGDEKPAPVTPKELAIAPTAFNASMIPFSSKWCYLEPTPGDKQWADLDKYVDFCTQHDMTMEFHYLSGILPIFMRTNPSQEKFTEHALETVGRYADRIRFWQVENEKFLFQYTPEVFKALRAKYPNVQLGIADCVRLWSGTGPGVNRNWDQFKGWDALTDLQAQGIKIDYFGLHGHHPSGLWADPREVYSILDRFAERGVRVHLTEEYLPPNGYPLSGPVRRGTWTPELKAEYFVRYMTVAFSHPDCDLVNLWGMTPSGWGPSGGMEDAKGNPEPSIEAIRKLTHETYHTHVEGTTPLDGKIAARAFHGKYELTVTLANGKTAKTTFTVPEQTAAAIRLTLDPATGQFAAHPEPRWGPLLPARTSGLDFGNRYAGP